MKWFAALLLLILPIPTYAAIAFDAATYLGQTTGTFPTQHTATVNNTIVLVGIINTKSTDNITAVTYGGQAMTRVSFGAFVTGIGTTYLYCIVNPPSGAQSVVATETDNTQNMWATAASYTGVAQSCTLDAVRAQNTCTACTSLSSALTSVADNAWATAWEANSIGAPTAGAGTTLRVGNANGLGSFDGNAVIHPAGSATLITNIASSGNQSVLMATIAPFATATAITPTIFRLILFGEW